MTPEERLDALEKSIENLTARAGQFEAAVTSLGSTVSSLGDLSKRVETLEAPSPYVVKAKGVLSYLWDHRSVVLNVVLAVLLMTGVAGRAGQGCQGISCEGIKCDGIGTGCQGCNPLNPGPPAPIPEEGLRVLLLTDSDAESKFPASQIEAMHAKVVRDYLDSHCAKGADGKTPEYHKFEPKTDVSQLTKSWQDAFARVKDKTPPWLIISNGTTNQGYEGPEPTTVEEKMTLLKKYGGQ